MTSDEDQDAAFKPALRLLPKGQHQLVLLGQEGKASPLLLGFSGDRESKNLLVEVPGSIQVAHIQTDMTCLEAYFMIRTHGEVSFHLN